jgi:hypothetical protein
MFVWLFSHGLSIVRQKGIPESSTIIPKVPCGVLAILNIFISIGALQI